MKDDLLGTVCRPNPNFASAPGRSQSLTQDQSTISHDTLGEAVVATGDALDSMADRALGALLDLYENGMAERSIEHGAVISFDTMGQSVCKCALAEVGDAVDIMRRLRVVFPTIDLGIPTGGGVAMTLCGFVINTFMPPNGSAAKPAHQL